MFVFLLRFTINLLPMNKRNKKTLEIASTCIATGAAIYIKYSMSPTISPTMSPTTSVKQSPLLVPTSPAVSNLSSGPSLLSDF